MIVELEKYKETRSLAVSLRTLQIAFDMNDTQTMLTACITSTDSLLKLLPELSNLKKLLPKLMRVYGSKDIQKKYSIKDEIIWALNNARIIRNFDTHEPDESNKTTLYEAVGYCHLLVLLINSMLSSGNLALSTD